MSKFVAAIIAILGLSVLIGFVVAYSTACFAYVADVYWDWFILYSFPKLPNFTTLDFVAIIAMRQILFYKAPPTDEIKPEYKNDKTQSLINSLLRTLVAPWLVLLFGWIVKVIFF